MIDLTHLWPTRIDSLTRETYHNLIALRDSTEDTTSINTAPGVEIAQKIVTRKNRERHQKKTVRKPIRFAAMIEQFQIDPSIRDPIDDRLILSLDIPTQFNLNSITTNPDYFAQ